jgi:hypothetical protein
MHGFQLWANLPAAEKMNPPRYRGITSGEIPVISRADGTEVRVICGEFEGAAGPVAGVAIDPEYLDVRLPAQVTFRREVPADHTLLVYVIEGELSAEGGQGANRSFLRFGNGELAELTAGAQGARMFYISGRPLAEPIAWRGPIVMNSNEELRRAFEELRAGTFVRNEAG